MTKFVVLFVNLTAEQRENLIGWSSPVGQAYMGATFSFGSHQYDAAFELGMIAPAAIVDTDDIEDTFVKLQNIDEEWTANTGVVCLTDFPRSCSVGDLVYNPTTNDLFYCASFGFKPVTVDNASKEVISQIKVMALKEFVATELN